MGLTREQNQAKDTKRHEDMKLEKKKKKGRVLALQDTESPGPRYVDFHSMDSEKSMKVSGKRSSVSI